MLNEIKNIGYFHRRYDKGHKQCCIIVGKVDWQTLASEFESHWVHYSSGLVTNKQSLVNK